MICLFLTSTTLSWFFQVYSFDIGKWQCSNFVLQYYIGCFGSWAFSCKLQNQLVDIDKITCQILIRIALNQIKQGRTDVLTVLHLPVHELEISLHFSGSLISAIRVLWFSFLQILYVYTVCLCVYLVLYLTTFQGSISVNGGVSNFKFLLFTVGILKSSRLWYINIIWYNLELLAY